MVLRNTTWYKSGRADRGSGRREEGKLQLGTRPSKTSVHTGLTCTGTWALNPVHSCLSNLSYQAEIWALWYRSVSQDNSFSLFSYYQSLLLLHSTVPITWNKKAIPIVGWGEAWGEGKQSAWATICVRPWCDAQCKKGQEGSKLPQNRTKELHVNREWGSSILKQPHTPGNKIRQRGQTKQHTL